MGNKDAKGEQVDFSSTTGWYLTEFENLLEGEEGEEREEEDEEEEEEEQDLIGYEKIKFLNSIFPSRILFLESSSSPFKFSFSDSFSSRKKNVLCAAKEEFSQVTVIKDERCISNW